MPSKRIRGINNMSEEKFLPMFQPNKTFTTEFRGVRYEYYLTGEIGPAEDYVDLCNILRTASEQDEVVLRIRSGGGSVHTGNMIINAINESQANVIGFIESDCGSMATFIFLACHTWGVSESAEFFCHTCSYGTWGKEHENFTQAEFIRKQAHKQMRHRYKNFLSESEIESVISGADVYLDADEIMERLGPYAEARANEPCNCGDSSCPRSPENLAMLEDEEFDEETPTLESIIEKAVEEGVKKALAARDKKEAQKAKKSVVKPVEQKAE
nr:MAG TPA: hypothetical protein [Caudoviricetes sp.]